MTVNYLKKTKILHISDHKNTTCIRYKSLIKILIMHKVLLLLCCVLLTVPNVAAIDLKENVTNVRIVEHPTEYQVIVVVADLDVKTKKANMGSAAIELSGKVSTAMQQGWMPFGGVSSGFGGVGGGGNTGSTQKGVLSQAMVKYNYGVYAVASNKANCPNMDGTEIFEGSKFENACACGAVTCAAGEFCNQTICIVPKKPTPKPAVTSSALSSCTNGLVVTFGIGVATILFW